MTKDIDNRLFGRHRYLYSQNLEKPEVILLDTSKFRDKSILELLNMFYYEYEGMTYSKTYNNIFNELVVFVEYKGKFNRLFQDTNTL